MKQNSNVKFTCDTSNNNVHANMDYHNRIKYFDIFDNKLHKNDNCELVPFAKGGHSVIYKQKFKVEDEIVGIAIKKQKINKKMIQDFHNKNGKLWLEYHILKKTTEYVLNQITQNLPMLYDSEIKSHNESILFYSELATGSFLDWCYDDHTEKEWMSFLFQFWAGVYTLQKHLKLVHNDLRLGNVLYHKIKCLEHEYWKYIVDSTEYYVPNTGFVFIIWDFGSSQLVKSTSDPVNTKLELNIDLHFYHDLYNRLRVMLLMEKFTTDELELFFVTETDLKYLEEKKNQCKKFRERFAEKYKIALTYYLIENNKFDELKQKPSNNKSKTIKMPPDNIMIILKYLSENNYDYNDVIKIIYDPRHIIKKKISPPNILINKFFDQYLTKKPFELEFVI